jgi:hypothetical protein
VCLGLHAQGPMVQSLVGSAIFPPIELAEAGPSEALHWCMDAVEAGRASSTMALYPEAQRYLLSETRDGCSRASCAAA